MVSAALHTHPALEKEIAACDAIKDELIDCPSASGLRFITANARARVMISTQQRIMFGPFAGVKPVEGGSKYGAILGRRFL